MKRLYTHITVFYWRAPILLWFMSGNEWRQQYKGTKNPQDLDHFLQLDESQNEDYYYSCEHVYDNLLFTIRLKTDFGKS